MSMIKLAETAEEIEKALELRYEVQFKPWGLTREQSVKEQPSEQSFTIIFDEDGQILAAATVFVVGDAKAELLHLAVSAEHQSKGIGKKMVLAIEDILRKKGLEEIVIVARDYLQKFYADLGYEAIGELVEYPEFAEKGVFHQRMVKRL